MVVLYISHRHLWLAMSAHVVKDLAELEFNADPLHTNFTSMHFVYSMISVKRGAN